MAKVAGSIWVEGNNLHYIDQFNREWYMVGIFSKAATAKPGSIWIGADQFLYYINEAGNGVYYPSPYGDQLIPSSARMGSLWIDADNQIHWAGVDHSLGYRYDVRAHIDTAPVSTHGDTHTDGAHGDSHTDTPHYDVPSTAGHADYHQDYPHGDHWDNAHGDFWDLAQAHGDLTDHADYYPQTTHGDENYDPDRLDTHTDYVSTPHGLALWNTYHTDYIERTNGEWSWYIQNNRINYNPHSDWPEVYNHEDSHSDSPHVDYASGWYHEDHSDTTPHTDVPHTDVPHVDAAHQDAHTDTHGDSVHVDQPILIGP
jgi:hypothetical protein